MKLPPFGSLYIKGHKNTNDSNFILYRGPDSNFKGAPEKGLFNRKDTWMKPSLLGSVYLKGHKNTNDSNFILYRGPDSSFKGPMSQNSFIQPKRYMDETFSIGFIIP